MGHTAVAALISCATFDNEQHNIGDTVEYIEFYLFISENGFTERNHRRCRIERSGDSRVYFECSGSIMTIMPLTTRNSIDFRRLIHLSFAWFIQRSMYQIERIRTEVSIDDCSKKITTRSFNVNSLLRRLGTQFRNKINIYGNNCHRWLTVGERRRFNSNVEAP